MEETDAAGCSSPGIPSVYAQATWVGRRADTALWCAVPTSLLVLFIVVPLVALVWRAVIDPTLWSSLTEVLSSMPCG